MPSKADGQSLRRGTSSSCRPTGGRYPATGRRDWEPSHPCSPSGSTSSAGDISGGCRSSSWPTEAKVDQGQISRLERALAPAMGIERVVRLSSVLGRALPLGYCPTSIGVEWQPAPAAPPERRPSRTPSKARYLELILSPDKRRALDDGSWPTAIGDRSGLRTPANRDWRLTRPSRTNCLSRIGTYCRSAFRSQCLVGSGHI